MSTSLKGKTIAFLATDGFEQVELTKPWQAIIDAGATIELISLKDGEIQGVHHDEKGETFPVDKVISEVDAANYDGLVLPGGVFNPDALRVNEAAVSFVRDFFEQRKPIAAICHGPWMLIEADVVSGRNVASWPSLKTDLTNAGANWKDESCVVDGCLITSRNPDDLPKFCEKVIEKFSDGKQESALARVNG